MNSYSPKYLYTVDPKIITSCLIACWSTFVTQYSSPKGFVESVQLRIDSSKKILELFEHIWTRLCTGHTILWSYEPVVCGCRRPTCVPSGLDQMNWWQRQRREFTIMHLIDVSLTWHCWKMPTPSGKASGMKGYLTACVERCAPKLSCLTHHYINLPQIAAYLAFQGGKVSDFHVFWWVVYVQHLVASSWFQHTSTIFQRCSRQ